MEDSRRPAEGDSQSETRVPSAEESPTVDYFPDTPGAMLRPGAFGRYVLVRRLGKGGFGEVWEAQDTTTSRRVALKILMNLRSARADIRQRFHREARVTGSLNHPHVVSVFGAEEVEGYPVISMEIAQGGTLQDRLNREGSLTVTAAVDAVLQIIEGLEAASAQGIIHRDIKPSNCFLDSGGAVKIGDFGLSRTSESDSILTESGVFMGTPAYASPEQVKGRAMDLRSDIYSLGATLYALLSGKPPFVADGPVEVLARILSEKPPPISQSRNPIPPGLARVLDLSLAKNPKDRFQTYSDLRSALIPYSSVGFVPAVPGRRLCSYLIDDLFFFSCVFFNQGFLSFVLVPWSYFLFFEWRWGTTPGKKAMGLRVVSPGDHRMSFLQALTRASSFVTMARLPGWMLLPMSAGSMSVVASWLPLLIGAVSSFLPPVTMRKRNDYGCLHDLVSRTRVLAIRRQDGVEIQIPAWTPTPQAAGHTRFGVYEVRASVWSQGSEELLLGYDPVLSRNVWIYRHTGGTSRSVEALRFVRLQWLGGGEQEDGTWDVYECPPGTGLVDLLRHQGRLPWTFASRIVTELLGELELSQGESFFPTKLSLSHVWITTNGHVKLMQFPLHPQESSSCGMFSSESYLDFARQVLISALEGRVIEKDRLPVESVSIPLPSGARRLVGRLDGQQQEPRVESSQQLLRELKVLQGAPVRFSRLQRAILLGIVLSPLLLGYLFAGLYNYVVVRGNSISFIPDWVPEAFLFRMRCKGVAVLQARPNPGDRERQLEERVRKILAFSYRGYRNSGLDLSLDPETTRILEESLKAFPSVSREEYIGLRKWLASVTVVRGPPAWFRAFSRTMTLLTPSMIGSLMCAFLFRGGILFPLFGIEIQTLRGRKAGRFRCLFRSVIAWSIPLFLVIAGPVWGPWSFLPLAISLLGAVYSIISPARGIPDRIAGTCLLP